MTVSRAHLWIAAGAMVTVGVLLATRSTDWQGPLPDEQVQTSTRRWGVVASNADTALTIHWTMTSQAELGSLPALGSQPAQTQMQMEAQGTVVLTQLPDAAADTVLIHARVLNPTVNITGNSGANRESVARALSAGAFVRLDPRGTISDVAVATTGDAEALAIWRSLWGDLQLRLPGDDGHEAWEAREHDTKGLYIAKYVAQNDQIVKSKLHYVTDGHGRALTPDMQLTSHLAATWRWPPTAAFPTHLTLSESYKTTIDHRDVATGKTTLRLSPTAEVVQTIDGEARKRLAVEFARAMRDGNTDDLSGSRAWDSLARLHAKQQLGSHNDESLEKSITQDLTRADEQQLTSATFLALRARFLLDDAAVALWADKIKQWGSSDPRYMAVAETIAAAGTPACQGALVNLIESERRSAAEEAVAARLLPALGMVDQPTDASVAFIKALSLDDGYIARPSAVLSLGAVGQRLRRRDAAAAAVLYSELEERFAKSTGSDQGLMLAALGNLGDARQVTLVKPVLETASVPLKVDAVRSLRFVDSDARDDILTGVLTHETTADIRSAAAYALSFGSNPVVEATQRQRLRTERDPAVAQQLVHNLASTRHRYAENVEVLAWTAKDHPDANARRLAQGYLTTTGSEP